MDHSRLASLPDEVLDHILQCGISYCVLDLLKCGNKQLTARLFRSGCTAVDLRDDKQITTSHWPKVLSRLNGLRSLTLHCSQMLGARSDIRNGLRQLPKGLEELDLAYPLLDDVFEVVRIGSANPSSAAASQQPQEAQGNADATSSTPSTPQASKPSKASKKPKPLPHHYAPWDIGSDMPNLKRLRLSYGVKRNVCAYSIDFGLLPRNLQEFALSEMWTVHPAGDTQEMLTRLPPNLESLTIYEPSGGWTLQMLQSLPQSLRSLRLLPLDYNLIPLLATVSCLPTTLTSLHLHERFDSRAEDPTLQTVFHRFMNLRSLRIVFPGRHSMAIDTFLSSLPKTLTSLSLQHPDSLDGHSLKLLPHDLKMLSLFVGLIDWTAVSEDSFPPSLLRLATNEVPIHCLRLLPRTLVYLNAAMTSNFQQPLAQPLLLGLPPGITELNYTGTLKLPKNTPNERIHLPPSLAVLTFGIETDEALPLDFPCGLRELTLSCPVHLNASCDWLANARYLVKLTLEASRRFKTSGAVFKHLPPSLLYLINHNGFSDVHLDEWKDLPRGLLELTAPTTTLAKPVADTALVFAALPKSLLKLNLKSWVITVADLEHAPRSLRHLTIGFKTFESLEPLVERLPPSLHYFSCSMTPKNFQHFSALQKELATLKNKLPVLLQVFRINDHHFLSHGVGLGYFTAIPPPKKHSNRDNLNSAPGQPHKD